MNFCTYRQPSIFKNIYNKRLLSEALALLDDLADGTGSDGASAFADGEAQTLLHRDWGMQRDLQLDVVAGHAHLGACRQLCRTRHVRRAEVELGTVAVEERSVTSALFLREHIDLALEVSVGLDRTRLGQHHPALHIFLRDTAQQKPRIIARQTLVQLLLEHLDAGADRLAGLAEAHDLAVLAHLDLATLDTACDHRAAARDREDVFDRHQERLVHCALRLRNILVYRRHQLVDLGLPLGFAVERAKRRAADDRGIVARVVVLRQQLTNLELYQLDQLLVLNRIALVQEHDDEGNAYLTRQQNVLFGLGHRAVGRRNHENRAVHLCSSGDHVLDVVRVTRAVDVRVVPVRGLVLDVRGRNRDTALALLRSVVDRVERTELVVRVVLAQHLRNRRRQRRLAMIDVPDRPDVYVRL